LLPAKIIIFLMHETRKPAASLLRERLEMC
jgi:hypothetical protein